MLRLLLAAMMAVSAAAHASPATDEIAAALAVFDSRQADMAAHYAACPRRNRPNCWRQEIADFAQTATADLVSAMTDAGASGDLRSCSPSPGLPDDQNVASFASCVHDLAEGILNK